MPLPRRSKTTVGASFKRVHLKLWTSARATQAGALLLDWARRQPGLEASKVKDASEEIHLLDHPPSQPGPEAYDLRIMPDGIWVYSRSHVGFCHAVQTLISLAQVAEGEVSWPLVRIEDAPCFEWRGLLLDSCRHFISKAGVLRLIDQMAALKLNRLHWHLTDDQGWRLEIEKYPKLTEVGSWRMRDGVRESGYYSKQDVREIVAYASSRGVEIMPEIELPGHATAALAAYPELGCSGKPLEVGTVWGIYPHNYNAGDERVFSFLENVLEEVIELFPFPYIHLGADECMKDEWKESADCQRRIAEEKLGDEHGLQTYFINRVAGFLGKRGRTAVGWDEVLEGEISGEMVVQCWRDESIIKLALDRGYRVISAPRRHCYFDISVSQLDLADAYAFDPSQGLHVTPNGRKVMGGEATLWTEYIVEEDMDSMLFPRLLGLSEALWAGPVDKVPFVEFLDRARQVSARFEAGGVKIGPMLRGDGPPESMPGRKDLDVAPLGLDKLGVAGEA